MDLAAITDLMDAESWLTAQECLDYGLCTEITAPVQAVACLDAKYKDVYKKTPTNLLKQPEDSANNHDDSKLQEIANAIKQTDLFIALG